MLEFNHHKIKRQWNRAFSKSNDKSLHDFAWHKRKQNPLWSEEEGSWRQRLEIIVLAIFALATLLLLIYHPFFYLKDIEVSGLQRISSAEMQNTISATINYHRWFIFPGQNYFMVNLGEVVNIIKQKFPIQSITVTKKFPSTLSVVIEEKITNIIYDNGVQYSYVGTDGKVLAVLRKIGSDEVKSIETTIPTSTVSSTILATTTAEKTIERLHTPPVRSLAIEMGDYPLVYDKRQLGANLHDQVMLPNTVSGVISWFNNIRKLTDVPFGYITINNDLGEGELITGEGWTIKLRLDKQISEQFAELQYLLKNKIKRPNLKYIDLRYLGKVYWQ